MKTFAERLKARMKELGFTQEVLAAKMEITRGAITHYLAERREPSLLQIHKLARVLKCDAAWLQFGVSHPTAPAQQKTSPSKAIKQPNRIPLLNWDELKHFSTLDQLTDVKTEWVPCFCHQTKKSRLFALRAKGDAMSSPLGHVQSFQEGDLLIVDPDKTEMPGDYVIAQIHPAKEATFKRYVIDSGIHYLKPLNPQYPMIAVDKKVQICGVIIARIDFFK